MTTITDTDTWVTMISEFSGGVSMDSTGPAEEMGDRQVAYRAIAAKNGNTVTFRFSA